MTMWKRGLVRHCYPLAPQTMERGIYPKFLLSFRNYPTPADWSLGRTFVSSRGPCLSVASWSALQRLSSVPSDEASLGVNGFGSFCRNKRASAAGPKPGN
jgi:hypothetical protein